MLWPSGYTARVVALRVSACSPRALPLRIAGVGKTCLLLRYANDSFSPTFITTIGIDFKIKTIEVDSKRIKLQVRGSSACVVFVGELALC